MKEHKVWLNNIEYFQTQMYYTFYSTFAWNVWYYDVAWWKNRKIQLHYTVMSNSHLWFGESSFPLFQAVSCISLFLHCWTQHRHDQYLSARMCREFQHRSCLWHHICSHNSYHTLHSDFEQLLKHFPVWQKSKII